MSLIKIIAIAFGCVILVWAIIKLVGILISVVSFLFMVLLFAIPVAIVYGLYRLWKRLFN